MTEPVLQEWIASQMGIAAPLLLQQIKIIRDWKTGKSKGYGFVVFTEAIHATVCIDKCHGQVLEGRPLSVNQGKKKEQTTQIYMKKKTKPPVDDEEKAIQAGSQQEEVPVRMDTQEALMLRQLDPDLVDDSLDDDQGLFLDDDEDDDDGVDGFYVEEDDNEDGDASDNDIDTPMMNRQKRREMARQKKKKKPANRGFGESTE
jgi:RNA recognition motif-containing protein